MRYDPGRFGFRLAILAIVGMVTVSGAGAVSSLLLIDHDVVANACNVAAPRSPTREQDAAKFLVVNRVVTDATNQAGMDNLDLAGFPDAIAAIEIVVPLLTVLVVVAAAQRFADFEPYRKLVMRSGELSWDRPGAQLTPDARPPCR